MELQILLAGVEFGPYTEDKARQLLGDGFLTATDPAKRLDGTNWQPLSAVLGEAPAAEEPASMDELTETESIDAAPIVEEALDELPAYPSTEIEPSVEDTPPENPIIAEHDEAAPFALSEPQDEEPEAEEPQAVLPEARAPQEPLVLPVLSAATLPDPATADVAAPIPSPQAAPKLQVAFPSRGKKGAMRTGSLLAQEALHAARDRSGILAPVRSIKSNATAPVPEFEPEPAPPRRRVPVKLGEQLEEPAGPPPPRKTIKLTGRVSLPGTAPQLDNPIRPSSPPRTTTSPRLPAAELAKFSGFIARPGDIGRDAPEQQSGPLKLRERESGFLKPAPRKTIKLTGPVTLAGRTTGPTPPATRPPQNVDDEGPMVMARTSRPIGYNPILSSDSGKSASAEPALQLPPEVSATTEPAQPSSSDDAGLQRPAELASAAAVAAEEAIETNLTGSGPLSSELAARRSLKITDGTWRQPLPASGPIHLSSPSSESGPLTPITEGFFTAPAKLEPAASWPSPPVPEEDLPPRPPTGKLSVYEMPTEGVMVRTARRLTSKVALPAAGTEALAYESPARQNPPPLPRPKIELPSSAAFTASTTTETAPPSSEEPLAYQKFVAEPIKSAESATEAASPAGLSELAAAPADLVPPLADQLSRPEKVRLRRPVNLDLSSRAKPNESGRITLETFSKLAAGDQPEKISALVTTESAMVDAPLPPEVVAAHQVTLPPTSDEPPSTASPVPPPEQVNSALPLNFPKKLEEVSPVAWGTRGKSGTKEPSLVWLLYSIVGVGGVAAIVLLYLLLHRPPSPGADEATTAADLPALPANAAPPASASPPASAAPPSVVPSTPVPTPTAPATISTPASAGLSAPSTNIPPSTTVQGPDPKHQAEAFVSDGILKYQRNDFENAIAAYDQALELDPKSAEAFYNRGLAKAAQNNLDGAIADFSQALQVDPALAAAYYYRGLARHSKADLDGAIGDYNQAVLLNPNNAMAFFNRGLIRMQKDDIDGSIVDSTRAIQLDPHQISAYYDRGLGRLAKGAMDAALDDMRQFTQLAPQSAYTDYARLYIWLIQTHDGQLADANADLSAAMNKGWNGTPDSMVTRLGEYLLGQIGETELIKASASAIPVKDQGQRCEGWYFIGMRKLVEGDKNAAVDALRKCVDTQKTDYCEYILAEEELRTLAGSAAIDNSPPPPRALPVTLPDPGTIAPATTTTP